MSSIKVFIPRVLSTISNDFIIETFRNLNIGEIISIDVKYKLGEHDVRYCFAFITLYVFESHMGNKVRSNIADNKSTVIYYDCKETMSYWVVKPYIDKVVLKQQHFSINSGIQNNREIERLCRDLIRPVYSDEDDFNELSKAIDAEVQYYYNLWTPSVFSSLRSLIV